MILYYGNKKSDLNKIPPSLINQTSILLFDTLSQAQINAGETGFLYSVEILEDKILDFSNFQELEKIFTNILDDKWIRDEMELLSTGGGLLDNILRYIKPPQSIKFYEILNKYNIYKMPNSDKSFKYIVKNPALIVNIT